MVYAMQDNQQSKAEASVDARTDASVEPPVTRDLTPAALRALAEAEERRQKASQAAAANTAKPEVGGRVGPDPVRYGDWEKGGIAWDF